MPLFSGCTDTELLALLQSPHQRQVYAAGDIVSRAGEPCRSLMLLTQGEITGRMGSDEGREIVLERHTAPQVLASAFLFAADNALPVDITAATEATVWFINRDGFFRFLQSHPSVLRTFLQEVSVRSRMLADKVRGFAVTGLRGRVKEYLDRHGAIDNVAEVAKVLGVARPSLSRILAEMVVDGQIVKTGRGYANI
ncbi:MAG: Crp/Fnr family transcriptional regulator [bacterium P3]|nr:MAG: Crp/Fnr family transcriptional regulator [bacterium P3]KWW38716.1 MAG: Crp/Fnr family transcriptional regulator [bacterium F083]